MAEPVSLRDLVPSTVAVCECRGESLPADLHPAEEDAVRNATPARRREFASGRACARDALRVLGVAPVAVPRGRDRRPVWPRGVVGSITHCRGAVAAAVAAAADYEGLGIDIEVERRLPEEVAALVVSPRERRALPRPDGTAWDCVVFSAKESTIKASSRPPRTFLDIEVALDPPTGTFTAVLGEDTMTGRFAVTEGLVLTAMTRPRRTSATGGPSGRHD